eukprot:TRINITY_DN59708_c0_g1_i1.p1 TRINITY_DN59708_c0_g1~~TRINITY_DN59708_c0_g1_i1.p1  ORF type:complete len:335 (-),score=86.74 TRINITY_DN59708_c0_g1_i1:27-983(-)
MDPTRRRVGRGLAVRRLSQLVLVAAGLLSSRSHLLAWLQGTAFGMSQLRQNQRSLQLVQRRATASETQSLQGFPTLQLIQKQVSAGQKMKELGMRLEETEFKASALDGMATVTFDGIQNLRSVQVEDGAAGKAGGSDALAKALLTALQEGHDSSIEGTKGDVWDLYKNRPELMQAPLTQIGAGSTVEDLWANVTNTTEAVQLTEELFELFDKDKDGWWNLQETSAVQKATEGTDMAEEAFNSLIIAAAPDGGRHLTEEQMSKGLAREQVIDLYTNKERQRKLGFVLDIFKDHAKVFKQQDTAEETEESSAPKQSVAVD